MTGLSYQHSPASFDAKDVGNTLVYPRASKRPHPGSYPQKGHKEVDPLIRELEELLKESNVPNLTKKSLSPNAPDQPAVPRLPTTPYATLSHPSLSQPHQPTALISARLLFLLKVHLKTLTNATKSQASQIKSLESALNASQNREQALQTSFESCQLDSAKSIANLQNQIRNLNRQLVSVKGQAAKQLRAKCRALELDLFRERAGRTKVAVELDTVIEKERKEREQLLLLLVNQLEKMSKIQHKQEFREAENEQLVFLYKHANERISQTQQHLQQLTLTLRQSLTGQ
ncbi:hypothetical protein SpCBS45565_g00086 [Spizellomyces sp. 'palustris']|nr:hypothetical protein SpCBS45565_g00086 [Spizellomyces sp. 'palustris']